MLSLSVRRCLLDFLFLVDDKDNIDGDSAPYVLVISSGEQELAIAACPAKLGRFGL